MNSKTFSHIVRTSTIIGSSSVVTIAAGIARTKAVALVLGPTGIGLFGILMAIQGTIGSLAGMGLASSGAREYAIAWAANDAVRVALTRRSVLVASVTLGAIAGCALLLGRDMLGRLSLGSPGGAALVGILAAGVFALSINGAQTALLNGLQKIREFAAVTIQGNIAGMVIGIAAVWLFRGIGVSVAVVAVPVMTALAARPVCRQLVPPAGTFSPGQLWGKQRELAALGLVFMATALMTNGSQYLVRTLLANTIGMEATGLFQAAWNVSMYYLGFILGAMATDYFPRLSAVSHDLAATNRMVNEQTEAVLVLTAPVILLALTATDFCIRLLYTREFSVAADILRWQVLGDIFKVATWPLGYALFARGLGRTVLLAELSWNVIYIALVVLGTTFFGIVATGAAFLVVYIYYFLLVHHLVRRATGFTWSRENRRLMAVLIGCGGVVFAANTISPKVSMLVGIVCSSVMAVHAARMVHRSMFTESDSGGGRS